MPKYLIRAFRYRQTGVLIIKKVISAVRLLDIEKKIFYN